MKISARSVLEGEVGGIEKGRTTAHVRIHRRPHGSHGRDRRSGGRRSRWKTGQETPAVMEVPDVLVAVG